MQATSSFLVEDDSHFQHIMRTLNNMRILGIDCDAVICTEDGGMFRVHRSIMSLCSSYFRTIFTTTLNDLNCGDGLRNRTFITIPNVSASILELIILYSYTETPPVTKDNVQELLTAADQFNILGLVEECVDFLVKLIDPKNCIEMWRLGKECFIPDLEKEAFGYVLDHFVEVADHSKEFLNLALSDLIIILKDDLLNAEKEISVWNAVKQWIYHDASKRFRYLPRILTCVRLATMPIDDFQTFLNDPIISKSVQCRPYVSKVVKFIVQDHSAILKFAENPEENITFQPRLPRKLIFCIGGLHQRGLSRYFEAYDNHADSWKQVQTERSLFPRIAFHQCISLDKYIYVIGGTDEMLPVNTCRRFDTETMKFEEVAPMHEKRCFLNAVGLNGKLYAIGGCNHYHGRSKTAECFLPESNQWNYIASMNFKRSDAGACHIRNRIIVAGGYDGFEYLNSVEVYYVEFDQWCLLPEMNSCKSGLACVAIDNYVYAFGGFDGQKRLQTVEKYDLSSRQWFCTKPMRRPRSNFASAVLDGKVYIMGGYQGTNTITNESECFDFATHRWKKIEPLPLGLTGIAACTLGQIKNIKNYIPDSDSRSLLRKYLTPDLAQNQRNSDDNESQLTFDVMIV